jgi:hypothetical protein
MAMDDEAQSCIEHTILSNINLCQRNGDTELKEATIVAVIEALLKGSTVVNIPRPRHLWRKINTQNYVILELSKEQLLIPKVRPARTYSISPCEMNHLPWEIEQQAYNLIRIPLLCVTSYSQPLINVQYLVTSNKLLVNNNK